MKLTSDPTYGSHLPALLRCVLATRGPVLEIGCGEWSTPVLNAVCRAMGREFVSYETDVDWAVKVAEATGARVLLSDFHYGALGRAWSVVLVDHHPAHRRINAALAFADAAEFIVVHDCQYPGIVELMPFAVKQFRFHFIDKSSPAETAIFSNTREIPT